MSPDTANREATPSPSGSTAPVRPMSMTGFGVGRFESAEFRATVEVRTVNHRFLKVVIRASDPYSVFEGEIEREVRKRISRGTVHVTLRIERQPTAADAAVNTELLRGYLDRLLPLTVEYNLPLTLGDLVGLPGVVADAVDSGYDPMEDWPKVRHALLAALERVNLMRSQEGQAMAEELRRLADAIRSELAAIEQRAPQVVEQYRERLEERLRQWFGQEGPELGADEIAREVALFADRADIREEIVRLRSHLDQFCRLLESHDPAGRRLEFLAQEMLREANTIAAKANDSEISQRVVNVKSTIEQIRELVQNIE